MDPFETFCDPNFQLEPQARDCWDAISDLAVWVILAVAVLLVCACVAFVIGWKLA